MKESLKIGFWGLTGLVVSAMVGSGVFALPQNMALGAGAAAICTAWAITAVGMFFIANTLRTLSILKPEAALSGIYMYAKEGFGKRIGFFTAWGYWFSNVFAIAAFATVFAEALNYFFPPFFKGGNTIYALLTASIMLWGFYFLILKGIKKTALINLVGTCCKLLPVFIFIAAIIAAFNWSALKEAFLSSLSATTEGETFLNQIRNTMIITLWTFIGIEASIVLSSKVRRQDSISKAILTAFFLCITMYIFVSVLPFGILSREQIAAMPNPSTAGILEHIAGRPGAVLMNVGMLVSVLFATLSMITITAEVPFAAAKNKSFPKIFTKENKNAVPWFSLFFTVCAAQVALVTGFVHANAFQTLITITAVLVMPVYFITALYLFKLSRRAGYPQGKGISKTAAMATGILGTLYSVWLIYAANLKYLIIALIFLSLGIPVFLLAKKESASR